MLSTLKTFAVPKTLEFDMARESLFNDSIGVIIFTVLLALAAGSGDGGVLHVADVGLDQSARMLDLCLLNQSEITNPRRMTFHVMPFTSELANERYSRPQSDWNQVDRPTCIVG